MYLTTMADQRQVNRLGRGGKVIEVWTHMMMREIGPTSTHNGRQFLSWTFVPRSSEVPSKTSRLLLGNE